MEISQFVGLGTINDLIEARRDKFVVNFGISDNYLCRFLNSMAQMLNVFVLC